jgi:hypothetical protein
LEKTIFRFFVVVMTAVASLALGSCCWGDDGGSDGRATETSVVEDPRLGDASSLWHPFLLLFHDQEAIPL